MTTSSKRLASTTWLCAFLCLTLTLAGAGCSQPGTGRKVIGVTLLTKEHVFYRDLESGLKETAEKKGYDLLITSGDWDLAKQQGQIENFIVQKVAAIIVCPVNSKGIGPAIEKA
ncbi:MAG: substrate-binding domain-containing protein, partial [Terriglobia bacterium]